MASAEAIFRSLKPTIHNPVPHFLSDIESSAFIAFEACTEAVGIGLQWNLVISAAMKEAAHLQFRESGYARLRVLFYVHEFVE